MATLYRVMLMNGKWMATEVEWNEDEVIIVDEITQGGEAILYTYDLEDLATITGMEVQVVG